MWTAQSWPGSAASETQSPAKVSTCEAGKRCMRSIFMSLMESINSFSSREHLLRGGPVGMLSLRAL